MLTSTRRGISYPNTNRLDAPDIPAHLQTIVAALDIDVLWLSGTDAALPAASLAGRAYWATDTTKVYLDLGTAWITIYPQAGVADGSITTAKLADGAVTTVKLADGSVTSAKIVDGTIVTADLADGSVTSAKIVDGTILTQDIADNQVTNAKIVASAVDAGKLASNAVTDVKLADAYMLAPARNKHTESGYVYAFGSGGHSVSFARTFASTPRVVCAGEEAGSDSSQNGGSGAPLNYWTGPYWGSIGTTGFSIQQTQGGTRNAHWIASDA